MIPEIGGQSWQVAYKPELGELGNGGKEQMVDHAFFRAADGTWRLLTQIRDTAVGRLFFSWKGGRDFEFGRQTWIPQEVCLRADKNCGESAGTSRGNDIIQAPHVFPDGDRFFLVYGGGPVDAEDTTRQVSLGSSQDGNHFFRVLNAAELSRIAVGPGHCADNFLLKHEGVYYLYSGCSCFQTKFARAGVVLRTSASLEGGGQWSDYEVVHSGGICGDHTHSSQSVTVVFHAGYFYLFKMGWSGEFKTAIYRSENPHDFGRLDEKLVGTLPVSAAEVIPVGDKFYLSTLLPDYGGVAVMPLVFR